MASDYNVPAECESAQCSSRMSSAETRTRLSYSLTCVIFVKLSRKLLRTVCHVDPHWSQQGDGNMSQAPVKIWSYVTFWLFLPIFHVCPMHFDETYLLSVLLSNPCPFNVDAVCTHVGPNYPLREWVLCVFHQMGEPLEQLVILQTDYTSIYVIHLLDLWWPWVI